MKRWHLLSAVLLVIGLASSVTAIERQEDATRLKSGLTPVYQNDGDTTDWFALTAASDTWTVVKTARDKRRRLHIQLIGNAANGVCIGSITATATECDDSTPGIELSTGSYAAWWADLMFESTVTCRARAGSSGEKLKGFETYDSGD